MITEKDRNVENSGILKISLASLYGKMAEALKKQEKKNNDNRKR